MRRSNTFKDTVHRVARGAEYHGENYEGELQGPRQKKSTGRKVISDVPIRTLSHYANFGKNNERVRPIIEWPQEFPIDMHSRGTSRQKRVLRGNIANNEIEVDYDSGDDETTFTFNVPRVLPDSQFSDLDEDTKVIALANNRNAEHAILLFMDGSNVWSVGYGFSGSGSQRDERHGQNFRTTLDKATKLPDGAKEVVAHAFETLQGALYTADYLLANWEQEAHIIWAGLLNNDIKQRVLNYLSHVNTVELKSKGDYQTTGKLFMTNNTTLQVGGSFYTENASWISKDLRGRPKLNCLEWVKHILGVPLKCGLLGRPSSCNRITPEQWSSLMKARFFGNLDEGRKMYVLKEIQTSLLKTDPASFIGDTARMATKNPRTTAACIGVSCAAGAAFGPCCPAATTIANTVGTTKCLGAGALCGLGTHEAGRRGFNKIMESKSNSPPSVLTMSRSSSGGRKTRRKNKRRKTRNKRKRRRRKSRNRRKSRGKRKTRR